MANGHWNELTNQTKLLPETLFDQLFSVCICVCERVSVDRVSRQQNLSASYVYRLNVEKFTTSVSLESRKHINVIIFVGLIRLMMVKML